MTDAEGDSIPPKKEAREGERADPPQVPAGAADRDPCRDGRQGPASTPSGATAGACEGGGPGRDRCSSRPSGRSSLPGSPSTSSTGTGLSGSRGWSPGCSSGPGSRCATLLLTTSRIGTTAPKERGKPRRRWAARTGRLADLPRRTGPIRQLRPHRGRPCRRVPAGEQEPNGNRRAA